MKKVVVGLVILLGLIFVVSKIAPFKNVRPAWLNPLSPKSSTTEILPTSGTEQQNLTVNGRERTLTVPAGYQINVFASDLGAPRFMAVNPQGTLLVSVPKEGKVVAIPDENGDGTADKTVVVTDGLRYPHGLAFLENTLYIAEENGITRVEDTSGDLKSNNREQIVSNVPFGGGESTGRGHRTRTIGFDIKGTLYFSIGSSCNACEEEGRGVIMRFDQDGKNAEIFAFGLRNAVGFVFHPETDEIWATDNGRDLLGDDFPPDEINIIKEGKHYGWPYCNGNQVADPDFGQDKELFCTVTEPPYVGLQAHSAPLGLRFVEGKLLVAFHGSWNRSVPTGYKVVSIDPETREVADWITGWLVGGSAWGRPVDIIEGRNGEVFISDDHAGVIYRLVKK